jgi:hypothetical protein
MHIIHLDAEDAEHFFRLVFTPASIKSFGDDMRDNQKSQIANRISHSVDKPSHVLALSLI